MKVKAVVFFSSSSETHQSKFFKRLINILLQEDSGILFFLSFWVKMKNWKLLGELSAEEVKLECERANLVVKQNSSQNLVRLSKYIMTTGYDPETFYFNTLYQGNKNAPLVGMAAPGGNVQAGFSSSRTRILPLEAAPTPASSSTSAQLDESVDQILALLTTMAGDVQRLVTLTQQQLNALPPTPFIGSGGRSWSDDGQT